MDALKEELKLAKYKMTRFSKAATKHEKQMKKMQQLAFEESQKVERLTKEIKESIVPATKVVYFNNNSESGKKYHTVGIQVPEDVAEFLSDPEMFRAFIRSQALAQGHTVLK